MNLDMPKLFRRTTGGAVLLAVALQASPAAAAPPDTWEDTSNPSFVGALVQIGVPVLILIALCALMGALPSMLRGNRSGGDPAMHFQQHPEWFGGTRRTVEAGSADAEHTGGASAKW